jgi:hypothetical protein
LQYGVDFIGEVGLLLCKVSLLLFCFGFDVVVAFREVAVFGGESVVLGLQAGEVPF